MLLPRPSWMEGRGVVPSGEFESPTSGFSSRRSYRLSYDGVCVTLKKTQFPSFVLGRGPLMPPLAGILVLAGRGTRLGGACVAPRPARTPDGPGGGPSGEPMKLARAVRLELTTYGFGDRRSTS